MSSGPPLTPPRPAEAARRRGDEALARLDLQAALAHYSAAVTAAAAAAAADGDHETGARSQRAVCHCLVGNWRAAVADLDVVARLRPRAPAAHARLAEGRLHLGDYGGARRALQAARVAAAAAAAQGEVEEGAAELDLAQLGAEIERRCVALAPRPAPQPQPQPEPEPELARCVPPRGAVRASCSAGVHTDGSDLRARAGGGSGLLLRPRPRLPPRSLPSPLMARAPRCAGGGAPSRGCRCCPLRRRSCPRCARRAQRRGRGRGRGRWAGPRGWGSTSARCAGRRAAVGPPSHRAPSPRYRRGWTVAGRDTSGVGWAGAATRRCRGESKTAT
jgi:hypothetical protein